MNSLKQDVDRAVADFCATIVRDPLLYFSEADLQQMLVERLRDIDAIGCTYPTKVRRGDGSKTRYRTSPIHREYARGGRARVDIVVFDPADVREIDVPNLMIRKRYLRPLFAFELGTEKTVKIADHLRGDVEKLDGWVKDTGYVIHFYKDVTATRIGTPRRDRTEDKIRRIFKSVVADQARTPRVKILPIVIRTGQGAKKMWGKCELYDGDKWTKVNVGKRNDLKVAFLRRLREQ